MNCLTEELLSTAGRVGCASLLLVVALVGSGCAGSAAVARPVAPDEGVAVQCDQRMPPIVLKAGTSLSAAEESTLCVCVWNRLGGWDRNIAAAFARDRALEISPIHRRAFPARFTRMIGECQTQIDVR